jgi:hypothetical protein
VTARASEDWLDNDPVSNGGYGGARPTFAQLQQSGIPRPPAPAYSAATKAAGAPAAATAAPASTALYSPHILKKTDKDLAPSTALYDPHIVTDGGGTRSSTPTTQFTDPNAGESPFEKGLRERYESSPNAPQFSAGTHAQTAATFVPGANPFTPGDTYQPGQFAGKSDTTKTLDPAILKNVMELLQNPSGYTTDVAKSTYDRLGGAIDDQYNVDNQHINEDMARRGLSVSTIGAGRLSDSNVARKSAKEDLAGRILSDQASTLGADRARAIATASGMSDDEFNRLLTEYQQNTAAGQTGFANKLASGQFNEGLATDTYNADEAGRAFNSKEDQRGFDDALSAFGANRASSAQDFGEKEQKLKDYLGFGQQSFQNSLDTQQANNQQQQQLIQLLTQIFGGTGGGGA